MELEADLGKLKRCDQAGGRDPWLGRRTDEIVVAEIGPDLSRFPSFKHSGLAGGLVSRQQ
jgi:hypothetical protein